ncbi:MAG: rhomboid family intramembrane serine protease [Candidatus Rokubacteria bacterium]|nr:rhomboid family intramembrane serine protease [Candidatus Rokubacteria bacterium]
MIPLKDDIPSQTPPVVTVTFIVLNALAFLYQLSLEMGPGQSRQALGAAEAFVYEFGLVPCRLTGSCPAASVPALIEDFPHPFVTIFTSMFLHGGLFHIAGNMLYLWIFGNNVEDTLGHGRFAVFYLACGVAAALGQTAVSPTSWIPMIGASGAVSGVLGAYLLLFPRATILTLVTLGIFIRFVHVPALVVLGFWIIVQFANGVLTLGVAKGEGGGVAWFAHIAGFLAGMLLLFVFRPRRPARR